VKPKKAKGSVLENWHFLILFALFGRAMGLSARLFNLSEGAHPKPTSAAVDIG
jgi:hypothetical protein